MPLNNFLLCIDYKAFQKKSSKKIMPFKKQCKSTPGRRHQLQIIKPSNHFQIHSLQTTVKSNAGRNNRGVITVQGQGGGKKTNYRLIDWKLPNTQLAIVKDIFYNPNISAFIALIIYNNGLMAHQIAVNNLHIGQLIQKGVNALPINGNSLPLFQIPDGTKICLIETKPGQGPTLCRSAGTFATCITKTQSYALISLKSGIFKHVSLFCYATIGQISNLDHNQEILGKAGISRNKGIRPTVRGVAKNPVDHPHGGGQGKTSGGRPSVTPKGRLTKGAKTRKTPTNFFHLLKI
jgi:large subunit ribosomal protein L2